MNKLDLLYIFKFENHLISDAIERLNYSINSITNTNINICVANYSKVCIKNIIKTNNKFKYIHNPLYGDFSRSKVINQGVKDFVKTEYFILSDIDLIYSKNHFQRIMEIIKLQQGIPLRLISYNSNQRPKYNLQLAYSNHAFIKKVFRKISKKSKPKYYSEYSDLKKNSNFFEKGFAHGNGVIHLDSFNEIGGYDEEFIGYGPEDDMFNIRISFINKLIYYKENDLLTLHLWHPRYNMVQFKKNMKIWS